MIDIQGTMTMEFRNGYSGDKNKTYKVYMKNILENMVKKDGLLNKMITRIDTSAVDYQTKRSTPKLYLRFSLITSEDNTEHDDSTLYRYFLHTFSNSIVPNNNIIIPHNCDDSVDFKEAIRVYDIDLDDNALSRYLTILDRISTQEVTTAKLLYNCDIPSNTVIKINIEAKLLDKDLNQMTAGFTESYSLLSNSDNINQIRYIISEAEEHNTKCLTEIINGSKGSHSLHQIELPVTLIDRTSFRIYNPSKYRNEFKTSSLKIDYNENLARMDRFDDFNIRRMTGGRR